MDILVLEEIANSKSYSWIKVKAFKEPDTTCDCELSFLLEEHHEKETKFLIKMCRRLAKELLSCKAMNNEI